MLARKFVWRIGSLSPTIRGLYWFLKYALFAGPAIAKLKVLLLLFGPMINCLNAFVNSNFYVLSMGSSVDDILFVNRCLCLFNTNRAR